MCVWLWSNHSFLHFIHFSLKKLLLIGLLFDWRNHDFILTEWTTEESIPFDFHALWHQVKKSKSQGTLKRYDTRKSWGRGEEEGGDRHYHPSVPFFLVKFLLSLLCFYTIFEALTFLADHVVDWQVYVEKKKERRRWTMTLVDSTERNFFLLFFVTSSLSVNHMCDEIQEPKWFYSPFNPFKNLFSTFLFKTVLFCCDSRFTVKYFLSPQTSLFQWCVICDKRDERHLTIEVIYISSSGQVFTPHLLIIIIMTEAC